MKKKLFNGKINYTEIRKVINANLDKVLMFSNNENIETGLKSFSKLGESPRLISIVNYIDDNYNERFYEKVPIILTASIILDKYSDRISDFSDMGIVKIADFGYLTTPDNLEIFMAIYSEEILNEIGKKSNSLDDFINYMFVVEDKYYSLVEESTQNINEKLISYTRNITDSDYQKYVEDINRQIENTINREGIKY